MGRDGTFGDDERLELPLVRGALHDLRLDGVLADNAEDEHGACLPDAVRAVLRLQVHLRVLRARGVRQCFVVAVGASGAHPVLVVEDDRVGGDQVEALSAGPCAQEKETRGFLAALLEPVQFVPTLGDGRRPVNAAQ